MKKALPLLLALLAAALPAVPASALSAADDSRPVSRGFLFSAYFTFLVPGELPLSDRPALAFPDAGTGAVADALAKAVRFSLLPNAAVAVRPDAPATDRDLAALLKAHWGASAPSGTGALTLGELRNALQSLSRLGSVAALRSVTGLLSQTIVLDAGAGSAASAGGSDLEKSPLFPILTEEFRRLREGHYDGKSFTDQQLVHGAARGMMGATGDKWGAFFPPEENQSFQDELSGTLEGIGAYVDMPKPGELVIVAPISGSPAEKAGLAAGDRVMRVDGKEIGEKVGAATAVSWIKGPAGTQVELEILRGAATLKYKVTRAKITIPFVEDRKLDAKSYYVKITSYGVGSGKAFAAAMARAAESGAGRIVIDLRNNPGGLVDEAAQMLSLFVPKGEPTIVFRSRTGEEKSFSDGPGDAGIGTKFDAVIVTNAGTASAAEIFAGTLKDYFPKSVKLVGEKSYGKGSVQTQSPFADGSNMKFTAAKWFTGKSATAVDGVGISPDVPCETGKSADGGDPALDRAREIQF